MTGFLEQPAKQQPRFIFGGETGVSYADLQNKRKIAQQLMSGMGRTPRNAGEGLHALGQALMYRGLDKQIQKGETKLQAEADALWGDLFGGSASSAQGQTAPEGFNFAPYAVGGAASRPDSFTGLKPDMQASLASLLQAADKDLGPGALRVTSAYRSPELQGQLFADAVAKYGSEQAARKWVAPAGRSQHNHGNAVDFAGADGGLLRDANSREAQWLKTNAAKHGLAVPMDWEPWQLELAGARGGSQGSASPGMAQIAQALSNPSIRQDPARVAILNSLMQREMQASDPMRQIQLQLAQAELDKVRNPQPGFSVLSPEQETEFGLDPAGSYQRGANGKISQIGGGKSSVNVSVGLGPNGEQTQYSQPVTPAQKKVDEEFAKTYVPWSQGGGADMASQIAQIETVAKQLEAGDANLTGPGVGSLPDWAGAVLKPDAVAARETVENVVQRNLRILLGAQFTAKEGERLIARAYNPRLPEAENAKRLRRLSLAMQAAAQDTQSQADHYEKNGTLTGWTGREWTIADFEAAIDGDREPQQPSTDGPSGGPQVGETEDGYRFLGGDPSDPNNWEQVN